MRVVVVGGNTNLLHLHNDHPSTALRTGLGSNSMMSYNSGGGAVGGSRVRYYPYGDWHTAPTQTFTDIGYTGQRENMELGLYYYNARYYLPGIGRFASADTVVPDPANPQTFNRYSYALNNPVRYSDPTGHYVADASGGAIDPDDIVDAFYKSGDDTPLDIPIVVGNEIVGHEYWMPEGSIESTISKDSLRYDIGRFLYGTGIVIDVAELILSVVPGQGFAPGYFDAFFTYTAGAFTGENYGPWAAPPDGLPQSLVSLNQDALWNVGEAFLPPIAASALAAGGFIGGATTPVPGDELIYGGMGAFAVSMIDATTSGVSALYDYGRYTGEIPNYITLGHATGYGGVLIHWPSQ